MSKRRKQKIRLFRQDHHCYFCKCETILVEHEELVKNEKVHKPIENMAVLHHLRSRYNGERWEPNPDLELRRVLACWKCSNEHSHDETKLMPKEVLREKSKMHHIPKEIQRQKSRLYPDELKNKLVK